jgi:pSer/pThr/pTyr-binding forkhead associated (FHA) protein
MSTSSSSTTGKRLCVTLRCNTGAHAGQKFRLEAVGDNEDENMFKIGRSTGRQFKEKGVSLYKDKEISTTHAIIEIKFGQAFFTDVGSTNGSLLNDAEIERKVPIRLQDNDILMLGSSELHVNVTDLDDEENGIVSV